MGALMRGGDLFAGLDFGRYNVRRKEGGKAGWTGEHLNGLLSHAAPR